METTLIRAFVLMLALTGFGSSSVSSTPGSSAAHVHANSMAGVPAALCAPSDPSHCGMD
jgi:hypothetical protein